MKLAAVVTVFLEHEGRIALFRRSASVSTYQGCWAGVSGYLEGEPVEHFKVELAEETGLNPYEYRLLRAAKPIEVADGERLWLVHPFLCRLLVEPGRIVLDREHDAVGWFEPAEIGNLQTVPGLYEAWHAVSAVSAHERLEAVCAELAQDRHAGAHELARRALEFLAAEVEISNAASCEVLLADLGHQIARLSRLRPSMAAIATSLALVRRALERESVLSRATAGALIGAELEDLKAAPSRAAGHLQALIAPGSRVLLHSYSSSVTAALPLLKELNCSVVVSEARPGLEGRRTAAAAAAMGLDVTLVSDAAVASLTDEIDLALFGSDSLLPDGSVINKAGTALFAAWLESAGRPVYFLAERRKLSLSAAAVLEVHESAELWDAPPDGLKVLNCYFDRTPARLIAAIVLEDGPVEPYQIRRLAEEILHTGA
ncbi:MAG: Methylthioribose-1-phosphate isomerase [Deltaproteobacteria bacterium ADurb.Bin510]|nr:MAG: Methylthioribose-1-phosphate isomerase [Deltaproteobacteria bacterium ADurb.Bin510]